MASVPSLLKQRADIQAEVQGVLEALAGLFPTDTEIPTFRRDIGGEQGGRDLARDIFVERRLLYLASAVQVLAEALAAALPAPKAAGDARGGRRAR